MWRGEGKGEQQKQQQQQHNLQVDDSYSGRERERERERQGKIISGYSRWTTIHWTDGTRMAEDLFLAPDKKVIS